LGSQAKEGTFEGFDSGRFLFSNAKGRLSKEQPSRVTKLVLVKPLKVTYVTVDSKKEESALLKGYDKREFQLVKDGKEIGLSAMKMKSLEIAAEAGPGGGGTVSGTRYPVPQIDVDALAGPNPTPAQQKAVERFKTAKKAYDDFLLESSALVSQMDKATGAKREAILNDLRMRKNEEQPLKTELVDACSALNDAFPEGAK
jgi:hypothetical protein